MLLHQANLQLAALGSIDSCDYILQDHLWFKDRFDSDTHSVVLSAFEQCVDANAATSVFYGHQPSMLLVGKMEARQKMLTAMSRMRNHLTTVGKFALFLFIDREDDGQTFLSSLRKTSLSVVKKSLWLRDQLSTHKEMVTWIAYSTPESKCKPTGLHSAAVFETPGFMPPGQKLNKLVYREPELRLNQYAVQMHVDHLTNIMATLQLNSFRFFKEQARARDFFALGTGDETPVAHNKFQWQAELPNPFKLRIPPITESQPN